MGVYAEYYALHLSFANVFGESARLRYGVDLSRTESKLAGEFGYGLESLVAHLRIATDRRAFQLEYALVLLNAQRSRDDVDYAGKQQGN